MGLSQLKKTELHPTVHPPILITQNRVEKNFFAACSTAFSKSLAKINKYW